MLIFGGINTGASPAYDGNVWSLSLGATPTLSLINTSGTPPLGRLSPSMIYDASRDRIVIFGGNASTNGSTAGLLMNDVWTLNLSGTPTWAQLSPAGTPPAIRYYHTAIYDGTRDRMVVFAGRNNNNIVLNDVWALSFSGTPTWTQVTPSGTPPPIREAHSAVYDGPRDRMVVFGGIDPALSGQKNDTWALSLSGSGSWTQIVPNGGPPPMRYGHTAIVDAPRDRMLMFAGVGDAGQFTDVWSLSFTNPIKWTDLSPNGPTPSPPMFYFASVYDPLRSRMVSFDKDDFWALAITNNSTSWSQLLVTGNLPNRRSETTVIYDAPRQRLVMFGGADGTNRFNDVWAYALTGGGGWTELLPTGTPPSPREAHTAVFDPVGNRMVVYGGAANSGGLNDVWSLSLSGTAAWTQLTPSGTPPVTRWQHSAILDAPRNRMVIYGGIGGPSQGDVLGDVWALSLGGSTTWTPLSPTGGPPPLHWQHSAVFDAPRNRMLVFGGLNSDATVWALALAGTPTWSTVTAEGTPTTAANHVAVYDPSRDAMLVASENPMSTQYLSLGGSPSWGTLQLVGSAPVGRQGAGAAFDTGNDRWAVACGSAGSMRNDVVALSFPAGTYSLSLSVSPVAAGTIQQSPSGRCFAPETMVTLTAFAGFGYGFSHWSGDASGTTNPLTVTMSSSKSITANFVGYPVNVTVVPTGSGTVSKSPNQPTYAPGTQVTLTASSNVPFVGWSGDASGSENPLTIIVDGPKNITATFDANTVTTSVSPVGTGTVTKSPNQSFYATGSMVTLTANPITGYQFSAWSGDVTSTDNPVMMTVTGNMNVTANFTIPPPTCGGWSLVPPTGTKPPPRRFAAAIWDPVRHRFLIYGGIRNSGFPIGDTWGLTMNPAPTWTEVSPGSGGQWDVRSFYDPVRDRFVTFGGTSGFGSYHSNLFALPLGGGPSTWSQIVTAGTPPSGRSGAGVIYDPLRDRMLLFGGSVRCGQLCNTPQSDVWQLTLAGTPTWTQVFPLGTGPPAGTVAGAIYDPVRDRMVVMSSSASSDGAWALSLSGTPTWTNLNPWGASKGIFGPALYDPIRDRAIFLKSDWSGHVTTLDFKLDADQPLWSQNWSGGATLGSIPSPAIAYDPDDDLVLIFGGGTFDVQLDTAYRLDFGGGFLLDGGGTNGSITTSKWCWNSSEVATVVAQPNQGFKFNQWLGDASGTSNPLQLTMGGYKVVRAEFVPNVTGVEEPAPLAFSVSIRPNPTTGPAEIAYALPKEARVRLSVFDIAGREVARLVDGLEP
ncbi:MAG TPA: kelch repeat-containing protein, partial [Candidatus Eisenbacteria bacterium]|nr:kelch repeat-containing protein [Candidatus Eisenbacteria bacterium]